MEVKTIAVIGAGTMGRDIAYAAALAGYQTILEEVNETVPRRTPRKQQVFTAFDKFAKPNAVFASNTSSLSISDFTDTIHARGRCIGMHFFNPVRKMRLVEIVRTLPTSDQTVATCVSVAHRMHTETIIVHEAPGFITSRVNALIGNEALAMLETGIASAADIDKAIKLGFNHPLGPFEMVDLVRLKTWNISTTHWAKNTVPILCSSNSRRKAALAAKRAVACRITLSMMRSTGSHEPPPGK